MSFGDNYLFLRDTVIPRPKHVRDAEEVAFRAANHRSTWTDIALNIFSDASQCSHDDCGGYAVIFRSCKQQSISFQHGSEMPWSVMRRRLLARFS
jgi:hypothetical protein